MLPARQPKNAVQALSKARRFSTSASVAARSPYRPSSLQATKESKDSLKREQSTAAVTARRAVPSPAFNRDITRYRDVQPLQPYKPQELDHSFVGMTGGQIFHEMMLRQDVKHICELCHCIEAISVPILTSNSWLPWWCYSAGFRRHLQFKTLRFHPTET